MKLNFYTFFILIPLYLSPLQAGEPTLTAFYCYRNCGDGEVTPYFNIEACATFENAGEACYSSGYGYKNPHITCQQFCEDRVGEGRCKADLIHELTDSSWKSGCPFPNQSPQDNNIINKINKCCDNKDKE